MFQVLDTKLPRKGICQVLVADECFRKGNIAEIETDTVISEKDLQERLKTAHYVFPIMRDLNKTEESFYN